MLQWSELSWELQKIVLEKIEEKLLEETDIATQDAMVAALTELEVWSNSPRRVTVTDEDEEYIAEAYSPGDDNDYFN